MKKDGAGDRKNLARMQATLAATASRRKSSRPTDEHHQAPAKLHDRWSLVGKVTVAVLSIGIPLAALTFANADSHLTMVSVKNLEISSNPVTGMTSYTVKCAVFGAFLNTGLRSDFIDRIEIRPVKFDQTLKSEPIFVDREPISWREKKDLRFEFLVTTNVSFDRQEFRLTFYDSKGRQVGEMPIRVGFVAPKKGSPANLVSARVKVTVPERFRDPQRHFFVWLVGVSGEVIGQSNPEGELEKDGYVDLPIKFQNPIFRAFAAIGVLALPAPPAGVRIPMTLSGDWSDGSHRELSYLLTTTPDGRGIVTRQPVLPADGSPKTPVPTP